VGQGVHAHELHDDYHAPEKEKELAERINWGGGGGEEKGGSFTKKKYKDL